MDKSAEISYREVLWKFELHVGLSYFIWYVLRIWPELKTFELEISISWASKPIMKTRDN